MIQLNSRKGTVIYVNDQGVLCHAQSQDVPERSRIEFIPHGNFGLIVGPLDRPFALSDTGPRLVAHAVSVRSTDDGWLTLVDPWSRMYLCAQPLDSDKKPRVVQASRLEAQGWEHFETKEQTTISILAGGSKAEELTRFNITNPTFLDFIAAAQSSDASIIVAAMYEFLSHSDMEKLGDYFLTGILPFGLLNAVVPAEREMLETMAALREWWLSRNIPNRKLVQKRAISRAGDTPHGQSQAGKERLLGAALNAYMRRAVIPRKKSCVVATARSEGPYILEWVAYYKSIGFQEIFIYSNDNEDGSEGLLAKLAEAGEIVWINNEVGEGESAQEEAYYHALTYMPDILDYEWALFVDFDEYLVINTDRFHNLDDFLNWSNIRQVDSVAINWIFVSSSGSVKWDMTPITSRMGKKIGNGANMHIKSLFHPRIATSSQAHFPRSSDRTWLLMRRPDAIVHSWTKTSLQADMARAHSDQPTDNNAFILHYFHKSVEEFIWKFSRNRGNHPATKEGSFNAVREKFLDSFVSQFNMGAGDAFADIRRTAPNLNEEIQRLYMLPGVGAEAEMVLSSARVRLEQLVGEFTSVAAEKWGEKGREFLVATGLGAKSC